MPGELKGEINTEGKVNLYKIFMNKERIKKLILKYEKLSDSEKKKYNEQQTKDHFIRPLFEALSWNFEEDVWPETEVSRKRVDYAFKIDGVTKFYVEAKALAINLDEERWAEQAINYSWHKSVPWVILTDFEGIKVFNTEWDVPDIQSCRFIEISYREFLTSNKLHWLSRDSFVKGVLDKKADEVGRKPKRIIIDEQLAGDLVRWRETLYKDLKAYNFKTIDDKKILETVQTILNRLIFIRTLEDRNIEDIVLQPLVREWEEKRGIKANDLLRSLNKAFRKIDKDYDSGLFEKGICDFLGEKIDADDNTFVEIIDELYRTKGKKIRYNFADIPADIFGSIYEEYLDHIQKGDEVNKKTGKRKSQGIYYTPRYIVDYIVENTIGEILKNKTESEINNLKILDPACGSGSFLNRAYQKLIDYWQNRKLKRVSAKCDKLKKFSETYNKKHGNPLSSAEKMIILRNNIFGVDLDLEAVELARLNLLLKMVSERIKLPNLINNIQDGNSLISGSEKELKKYFGKKWRDKKPFNWREKFSEIFAQGGFDVVIGNPPYIKEFVSKDAFEGLKVSPYYQGKMDIWTMFACISIDLLKEGGILSFIAPNNWISNAGASIFRNKILTGGELKTFIDFGDYKVFKDAGIQTMILIFEKKKPREKYTVDYLKISDKNISENKLISDIFGEKIKINIEPKKLIDKNLTFAEPGYELILEKIRSKKNFELMDEEISNGIHHHHDSVNKERQKILGDNFSVGDGIFVLSDSEKQKMQLNKKELDIIKPSYTTEQLGRWYGNQHNKEWVIYTDSSFKDLNKIYSYLNIKKHLDKFKAVITSDNKPYGLHRAKKEKFFKGEKIIALRKSPSRPIFTYVDFDSYVSATFYIIKTIRANQKYLVAMFNSNLIAYWLRNKGKMQGNNYQLDKAPLVDIPICIGDKEQQKTMIDLVDKILKLNKELQKLDPILYNNEYNDIKKKIEKTDREINRKVYELYGLTEKEIKIVENN